MEGIGMKFMVLSPELEESFKQIKRRIRRLQSGGTIDSLRNTGVAADRQIGASFVSLKTLAAHYAPNEKLATLLWSTGQREEQIMACFLFPADTNTEKITQLFQLCDSYEVAEYLGSVFVYKHSAFPAIVREWIENSSPYLQVAALTATARHLLINRSQPLINPDEFERMTKKEYTDKYVNRVAKRYKIGE